MLTTSPYLRLRSMNPSVSRLNSGMTPRIRFPFGPGGSGAFVFAVLIGSSRALFMLIRLQKVGVDARFAVRDLKCSYDAFIEFNRSCTTDHAVNITYLAPSP